MILALGCESLDNEERIVCENLQKREGEKAGEEEGSDMADSHRIGFTR